VGAALAHAGGAATVPDGRYLTTVGLAAVCLDRPPIAGSTTASATTNVTATASHLSQRNRGTTFFRPFW
jgi:hypothetical protein